MSVSTSPRADTDAPGEMSQADVRAAVELIIASEVFARAERPARFLRHLVEHALRGEGALLKESLLGVDVFGREASWDPRLDPIVRQEAARLRKRLTRFYENHGTELSIAIELPVGTYVPVFRRVVAIAAAEAEPEEPQKEEPDERAPLSEGSHRRILWLALGLLSIGLLAGMTALYFRGKTNSSRRSSEASGAEALYLQGRFYWNRRTPESLAQAVDLFTQAVVHDPKYAAAYVGLADSYNLLREYSAMAPEQAYPRAEAAARRALELDKGSAEAHNSLAFVEFWWNWNAKAAEAEFERAIGLAPGCAVAHHWHATFLNQIGRGEEAVREIEAAQRLDPASNSILADKGFILLSMGRKEEAVTLLKQVEEIDPSFLSSHQYLADAYLAAQDYAKYLAELKAVALLAKSDDATEIARRAAQGFAGGGSSGMYQAILEVERREYSEGRLPAITLAAAYSTLDRRQEALQYLEESFQKRECGFLSVLIGTRFKPLWGEPGFQSLQARLRGVLDTGLHR